MRTWLFLLVFWFLHSGVYAAGITVNESLPTVPAKGQVTLLDLGAHKCIPCKMMAPILAKLEKEYAGEAAIIFIDVFKHREQAGKYNVSAIPTQIFFDKKGKEVLRHVGFMSETEIVQQLKKMGVNRKNVNKTPGSDT